MIDKYVDPRPSARNVRRWLLLSRAGRYRSTNCMITPRLPIDGTDRRADRRTDTSPTHRRSPLEVASARCRRGLNSLKITGSSFSPAISARPCAAGAAAVAAITNSWLSADDAGAERDIQLQVDSSVQLRVSAQQSVLLLARISGVPRGIRRRQGYRPRPPNP